MIERNEAYNYHKPWLTYYGRMRTMLEKHLDVINVHAGLALDWGCSFGMSTREIADLFHGQVHVIGLDNRAERLTGDDDNYRLMMSIRPTEAQNLLAKKLPVTFYCGDGYNPPFAPEIFEVIFMMNNLFELMRAENISQDQLISILKNNLALVKVNGKILIGSNAGMCSAILAIKKNDRGQLSYEKIIDNPRRHPKKYLSMELKVLSQLEEAVAKINAQNVNLVVDRT